MVTGCVIRRNEYHDSVFLMRAAKRLSEQAGILHAAALMATERNKALLAEMGVRGAEIAAARSSDLILVVRAESRDALGRALADPDTWLRSDTDRGAGPVIRSLSEALNRQPRANLAVISVPGQHAGREARQALENGLNVFLFSDQVPVEEERVLKELAQRRGLLLMGPDCGTAILRGVGVGFANVLRRGPIGVIGASGTGIQEFTCLVHRAGCGISHALGTGSRDLSDEIGGLSVLRALAALESDTETGVIALISKPPGPRTLAALGARLQGCPKPVVGCFFVLEEGSARVQRSWQAARTLEDAAALAVEMATGRPPAEWDEAPGPAWRWKASRNREQVYIRGLFAGGTFCYQAQQILREAGIVAHSNAPIEGNPRLPDPTRSSEHTLVDLGADEFTAGRPHPMIDSTLRCERILAEAQDPRVAVLLLDVILGYNAAADPAGELAPPIMEASRLVRSRGGSLAVVVSVCGSEGDPQGLGVQVERLKHAGALVFYSSARAARYCAGLVSTLAEASHAQ